MSHITLVRHGQANSGARDEKSYDKLSALGHQQAGWLGDHLRGNQAFHPRCYSGTLRRHIETANAMGHPEAERDARLNEIPYYDLAHLLQAQHGVAFPDTPSDFTGHLPQVFQAWHDDRLDGAPVSFEAYTNGVSDALVEIADGEGPALVITSGGLISLVMRQVLGLDITAAARMALAIMNTSVHRIRPIGETWSPVLFNAVPHLDLPERHFAQTHV